MTSSYFEQFQYHAPFNLYVLSNVSVATILVAITFFVWSTDLQMLNKIMYNKILGDLQIVYKDLVTHSVGSKPISHGYGTFVSGMFMTVFQFNFMGLVPYLFSPTTHVACTVGLSFTMVAGGWLMSTKAYGTDYLALFTPENSPIALAPFLVMMETVSQFSKVISLGVSLAANMTAGHLLLGIFSGFLFTFLVKLPMICNLCPSFCFMAMVALEMAVAFIQAYVFCLLTCVYLGEAYNAH